MPRKIVKITLGQEQREGLLAALWCAFGRKNFDATEVAVRAADVPELMATIDTAVPDCRSKSRRSRERSIDGLAIDILRGALAGLLVAREAGDFAICVQGGCGRTR